MKPTQIFAKQTLAKLFVAILFVLCCPSIAEAQLMTAASYPFTASQKTFTYLSGATPVNTVNSGYDDDYTPAINLGFTFTFCGVPYTTVVGHTNNYLCFGTKTTISYPASQAAVANIAPCVMAGWHDALGQAGSISYLTTGTSPNRIFTLEFKNWGTWNGSSNYVTYQYKLYEGGVIEIMYKEEGSAGFGSTSSTTSIGIANSSADWQTLSNTGTNPVSSSTVWTNNLTGKPVTGQSYMWGQIPCSGVPTTSVVGPNQVCANKPFTVTLSGLSTFSNLTYQWQSSPDGTTWTNITGATANAYTDVISVPKWYRCTVTCTNSGQSYTTAGKLVNIAPFYYCYCEGSKATNATGIDIGKYNVATLSGTALNIVNVKLDNGPGGPLLSNTAATGTYNDFRYTIAPIPVYRDSTYKFTVNQISSSNTFAAATAAVYIDYNRNGTFETFEQTMLKTTANLLPEPGIVRDTFKMPSTADIGITGMRVILRSGTSAPDTCASYTEGETEDYLVDIRYEPCTGATNAGTISFTDSTMCPGYVYSIADTTHEKYKSEISWLWQYSPDGLVWANMPNSANKDTINNILFSNTIYYRVRMVCEAKNDTTYSPAQRIGLKPAYKCYCYSLADGGKDNDSSDIGGLGLGSLMVSQGGPHLLNETAFHSRQDYTDLAPLNLWTERRYQLLVYHTMPRSVHADAKITLFMDYNNDKQYNIPEERVGTWFTSINDYTLIDSIMIPDSVIIDVPTGMRVILNNNVAPNTPSDNACGVYTSGETEDFIVMFRRSFPQNVANIAGMDNLGLYPNPTNGKFRIQFSGNRFESLTITVRNITGQQVLMNKYSHKGGQFSEELDMSGYAKGVYLVELKANGEKMTRKLVVQ